MHDSHVIYIENIIKKIDKQTNKHEKLKRSDRRSPCN